MIAAAIGALVLAAQAAGPAESAAAAPSAAEPAQSAKPKDDSQKVVCRNETIVGSMIPKRVCLTQSDWDAMRDGGKAVTQEIQTRAVSRANADMARSH